MHLKKCLLQGIKPRVVNHGILTKLSRLINLFRSSGNRKKEVT